ncbi:MAG: hypothetical protein COA94_01545 [Rickettsiales bacterium]|nr:MAG: hypothetical protein COA94_01545 [Rickettsiales bacterium]
MLSNNREKNNREKWQVELEELRQEWNLSWEGDPMETPTSIIIFARYKNQPAALKISNSASEHTSAVLKHYNGYGAARILKNRGRITLMKRCVPGVSLKDLTLNNEDEKATHILCDVIEKLHSNVEFEGNYRFTHEFTQFFDHYLNSGDKQIPTKLIEKASAIFADLKDSKEKQILLHGDLHHENIIYDQKQGWLAIDPKGFVGEACYEVGAFLRNPIDSEICLSHNIIKRRIDIICTRLGYDKLRVLSLAFAQSILAAVQFIEDGYKYENALQVAKNLEAQELHLRV